MTTPILAVLLLLMAAAVWLGCAGFVRLRTPLDRLHCVALVNVAAGAALTTAAFVADGASVRALKIMLITAASLGTGAATAHATGRALLLRTENGQPPGREPPA